MDRRFKISLLLLLFPIELSLEPPHNGNSFGKKRGKIDTKFVLTIKARRFNASYGRPTLTAGEREREREMRV